MVNGFFNDDTYVRIGTNISVTGEDGAYGIQLKQGDLFLEGANISAKVTDKTGWAYSVYQEGISSENTIMLLGKSQLTGSIYMESENDTVSIESGSKVTGGMESVEKLVLIINDSKTSKNALWNATADLGNDMDLEIEFSTGMTGDFVLINNKSGADWDDILSNDITLDLGDEVSRQFNLAEVMNNGYDHSPLGYSDYDFTLKTKGSQLILSVVAS